MLRGAADLAETERAERATVPFALAEETPAEEPAVEAEPVAEAPAEPEQPAEPAAEQKPKRRTLRRKKDDS